MEYLFTLFIAVVGMRRPALLVNRTPVIDPTVCRVGFVSPVVRGELTKSLFIGLLSRHPTILLVFALKTNVVGSAASSHN